MPRDALSGDCEENYVNVKWFGAKGDGSTDDTAAIQAAIDVLPGGGGTVSLPGGTYNISSAIRIGDGNAGDRTSSKSGIKFIRLRRRLCLCHKGGYHNQRNRRHGRNAYPARPDLRL